VGFLGKDGGAALQIASHTIVVPSQSTARIQEMHITIGHILCELIEEGLGINS
jgi:D-sedoheptulose 7-phosphate isomerase